MKKWFFKSIAIVMILITMISSIEVFQSYAVEKAEKVVASDVVLKPGITAKITATPATSSVKLSWKKVANATGYRVYIYKNNKWTKVANTTKTTYTVKTLESDTNYKFAVKAYNKTDNGTIWADSYMTVSAITTATKSISIKTKPTLTYSSIKTTSVKLSWNETKNSTQYRIYQSTDNKNWSLVKKTTQTSYSVTKLKQNTKYHFKVRAYKNEIKGPHSNTIVITTKIDNGLSLPKYIYISHNAENQISINWSKVSGANGFRVYKYDDGTCKWIKIKDTKNRFYTFDCIKSGTAYKFAVKPYKIIDGKKVLTDSKKVLNVSSLPDVVKNLKTEFVDKTTLKVTWSKQASKSVKYTVWYSTGENCRWNYKKVKTTSKNSCLIKGLNEKKGYVVCVAAYNVADGEKYWCESTYETVPQNMKNTYKAKEGIWIEYDLIDGKWKKTVRNVVEENGRIYYYDEYGLKRLCDPRASGHPGFALACNDCGKEECGAAMSAWFCKACKETIPNGTCHPASHYGQSH